MSWQRYFRHQFIQKEETGFQPPADIGELREIPEGSPQLMNC